MADRAVFLDRDGVINVEREYLSRIDAFEFLPGAVQALRRLQAAGWRLVVVTNQSGIARGYYSEQDYQLLTAHMRSELAGAGVHLDAVLHCPHLPDADIARYRLVCECRKPKSGMLLEAARTLALDLSQCVMVGDKVSDVQAGRAAGLARCWLVRSGHRLDDAAAAHADAVFDDLADCAEALLAHDPTRAGRA